MGIPFVIPQPSHHLTETTLPLSFLAIFNVKETESLLTCNAQQEKIMFFYSACCPLQVMEFYCESCETAMCLDCTEGEHREHVTVPLPDVVEQHKAALKTQLDAIQSRWGLDTLTKLSEYYLDISGWKLKHLAQIWHLP